MCQVFIFHSCKKDGEVARVVPYFTLSVKHLFARKSAIDLNIRVSWIEYLNTRSFSFYKIYLENLFSYQFILIWIDWYWTVFATGDSLCIYYLCEVINSNVASKMKWTNGLTRNNRNTEILETISVMLRVMMERVLS